MRNIWIILLCGLCTIPAKSLDIDAAKKLYEMANTAYAEEKWEEAIEQYNQIKEEYESAELYANLGNSYYKLGEISEAIYYYNTSLKLNPRDADVKYNLNLANKRTIDKIETQENGGLQEWWQNNLKLLGAENLAIWSIILAFIMLFLLGLYLLSKKVQLRRLGFYAGLPLFIISLFVFWFALSASNSSKSIEHGIVMIDKLDVKSAPQESATELFVLHAGTKVDIAEEDGTWYKISLGDDRVGWASKSEVRGF